MLSFEEHTQSFLSRSECHLIASERTATQTSPKLVGPIGMQSCALVRRRLRLSLQSVRWHYIAQESSAERSPLAQVSSRAPKRRARNWIGSVQFGLDGVG